MPRKSRLLPYVQANKWHCLSYVRRIPQELQQFLGGQQVIRRSLGVKATDCTDPAVISAWSAVNAEVEALLAQAIVKQQAHSTNALPVTPLPPRELAAIGAEPLRQLLNAGDNGQITADMEQLLANIGGKAMAGVLAALLSGDVEAAQRLKQEISEELLGKVVNDLGISLDTQGSDAIKQRLWNYLGDFNQDLQARQEGNFNQSVLKSKAPQLPQKKVTWEDIVEQYLISVGGITEVDGIGVGQDRIKTYCRYIQEFQKITGKHFPDEVDMEDARQFANHLATTPLKTPSQSKRIRAIRHLYRVAISYGLVSRNPLETI